MRLKDKVTVITGASRGIGRALALGFAAEGAMVVAAARTQHADPGLPEGSLEDTVHRITDAGGKAMAVVCDVTDEAQVRALMKYAEAEAGNIDVLINNAGISAVGPIGELVTAEWDRVMAVNVRGPMLMCKYILPGMMDKRRGIVINITSRSAIWDQCESLVYGPSKAALDRFTLNLALDMKPYNITVNGLGPGLVASEMTKGMDASQDRWGRVPAQPEEVVPAALWLAEQDGINFTGRIVHSDEFCTTWP